MSAASNSNEIKEYLLGSLSQEAQRRVEERILIEEGFFEELLCGEDELVDQYIGGHLSPEERDRFERHFLSTEERHQKLKFGRALNRYVSENSGDEKSDAAAPQTSQPTWAERFSALWRNQTWRLRAGLALAVVVVIVGVVWLALPRTQTPRTFHMLALNMSTNRRSEGVEPGRVTLPLDADALKISLTLPAQQSPAARYRVVMLNDEGEAKPLEVAGQDASTISVVIPSAQLSRGQFSLNLFTIGADGAEQRIPGSYFFNVE